MLDRWIIGLLTRTQKKELSGGPSLLQQVESQLLREFAAVASPSPVEDFKVQNPPRLLVRHFYHRFQIELRLSTRIS